jgi:predicted ATPase
MTEQAGPSPTVETPTMTAEQAAALIEVKRAQQPRPTDEATSVRACLAAEKQSLSHTLRLTEPEPAPIDPAEQRRQWIDYADRLWRSTGIDERSRAAAMDPFTEADAQQWWKTYRMLAKAIGTGMFYGLAGEFGCGKTVMAAMLLRRACHHKPDDASWVKPMYVTAPRLFRDVVPAFRDEGPSQAEMIARYTAPSLLVIDEAHIRSDSAAEDRRLFEILDVRYGRKRDTVLITNLGADEFANAMGPAVIDRMAHAGGVITCNWPSYRRAAS